MGQGRLRSRIGAGLIVLALCIAAITIASGWRRLSWSNSTGWGVSIVGGVFGARHIVYSNRPIFVLPPGWIQGPTNNPFAWWLRNPTIAAPHQAFLDIQRFNGVVAVGTRVSVLLWPLSPGIGLVGWFIRRWGKRVVARHALGLCPKCGYDLTGLRDSGTCPECGEDRRASPAQS
ncbi:MAG: hypothetical protein H7210_10265 [Pyrinomonadaceae bacterium]|nr:hypothetical protein [Phycisphaerales bacterium]